MAGEGEGGAEEEGGGLEGPGGEGGDEAGGLEGVVVVGGVVVVVGVVVGLEGRKVGRDEAERVVLGTEVEEMVGVGLTLLHYATAGTALRYGTTAARGGAPPLPRRAVRAPHLSLSRPLRMEIYVLIGVGPNSYCW